MGSSGDRRYSTPLLETFGKVLVGLTLVLGLVGILLLAIDGGGGSGDEKPASVQPAGSPVCLRVDAEGEDDRTPLEAALTQRFATTGSDPFVGWPRLVDGFWRWDGVGADAEQALDVADAAETDTVEDEQLVSWSTLRYDLEPADDAAWQASAVLLTGGDEARAGRLAALGPGLRVTVPSTYVEDGPPDDAMPHPLLPDTIPPGGTVVVDRAAFDAAGDAAVERDLAAAVPNLDDAAALAITPLGRGRVVVTVGTEAAVEQLSSLGLQVGTAAAALTDSDVGDYAYSQVTLDLGAAGGRAAYVDLLDGTLPALDDERAHRVDVTGGDLAVDRARALEPDVVVSESFYADGLRRSVEERADGLVTFTRNRPAENQARRFGETYDAEGELAAVDALVRMVDVSAADASRYNRSFAGSEAEVSGPVTIDLVLDTSDLEQIRLDATTLAAERFNDDAEGKRQARQALGITGLVTASDVAEWLEATVPARAQRVVDAIAPDDDFVDEALSDVLVSMADGSDAWSTYVAYTTALETSSIDAPRALASWGEAVERASGKAYAGFGRVLCTSV